jgi:hypothetical protein
MSALVSSMRVEDAVLISHELVDNAIDHARTQCRVTVRLTASTVRIFMSDYYSSAVPVLRTRAGTPCVGAASASLLVRLAAGAGTTIAGARQCRHRRTAHPPDPHQPATRQMPSTRRTTGRSAACPASSAPARREAMAGRGPVRHRDHRRVLMARTAPGGVDGGSESSS